MIVFRQLSAPIFAPHEIEDIKLLWENSTEENKKSNNDSRSYVSSYLIKSNNTTRRLLAWAADILKKDINEESISLILHKFKTGDSFPRHRDDVVTNQGLRKYVVGMNLSNVYEGGSYKIYTEGSKTLTLDTTPGIPYLMRADVEHEIEPITSGTRESCLIFLYEHNFKKKTLL